MNHLLKVLYVFCKNIPFIALGACAVQLWIGIEEGFPNRLIMKFSLSVFLILCMCIINILINNPF
jgi:hypothetical protein